MCSPLLTVAQSKMCEAVEDGAMPPLPPVDCLWSMVSSFPKLGVNSDGISFSYVILFLLFTYVTICMKLDPGIHIVMHLVCFLKTVCDKNRSNYPLKQF